MQTTEFLTRSADETIAVGRLIGERLKGGDIVAFEGGLGAGKTTITHGIAQGMGLKDNVSSPTFAIVNEYRSSDSDKPTLYHFDMYRISSDELESIGFFDYISEDSVILIEWSENISEELPKDCIRISINRLSENERLIKLAGGDRFDGIGN